MTRPHLYRFIALGLVGGAIGVAACSSSSSSTSASVAVVQSSLSRDKSPAVTLADQSTLVAGNTAFAFDLYHQILPTVGQGNTFFSPYSISLALAMAYAGAGGETRDQMASALHFTLPDATFPVAFDAVDLAVETPPAASAQGQDGKPFSLTLADAIFVDQSTSSAISAPFLDTLATDYGAAVHLVDFQGNPDPSRVAVNTWVADRTNSRIEDLLPEGSVNSSVRTILVNAIYFNASWASSFNVSSTHSASFTALDGTTPSVQMMEQTESLSYGQTADYQMVEIPYQGGTTSMIVVLPNAGNFANVEAAFDEAALTAALGSMSPKTVDVSLPKWTTAGASISLKSMLAALGMSDAFAVEDADFSGISTKEQLYLFDVYHQAFIDVDESGTEAAAATAVVGGFDAGVSSGPPSIVTFTVDHPYLVFIRDLGTGSILFFGRVTNPSL